VPNRTWEGGVRVPMLARRPDKIAAGSQSNALQSHEEVYAMLAAPAGLSDVKEKLRQGTKLGNARSTPKSKSTGSISSTTGRARPKLQPGNPASTMTRLS
jgi:arylsulfatase A-like enzyme